MRTRRLVTALSLLIVPAIGSAQQTPFDSVRAGTWAAEVFLGSGGTGASMLRFQSARFALLFGADFSFNHFDQDFGGESSSGTQSNVAARLGVRTYRQSSAERLRPIVGFGTRASYSKTTPGDSHSWTAGVYGELGGAYFLTPHVSLGGTGELQVSYGKLKQQVGIMAIEREQTTTIVSGSLMRVMLSVYF